MIAENPVEALTFFMLLLSSYLNWKIYCDDHTSLSMTKVLRNMAAILLLIGRPREMQPWFIVCFKRLEKLKNGKHSAEKLFGSLICRKD